MTGTEKQAKWAQDIKAKLQADVERMLSRGGVTLDEWLAMDLPDVAIFRDVMAIKDHRFWIDVAGDRSLVEIVNHPKAPAFGVDKANYGL